MNLMSLLNRYCFLTCCMKEIPAIKNPVKAYGTFFGGISFSNDEEVQGTHPMAYNANDH